MPESLSVSPSHSSGTTGPTIEVVFPVNLSPATAVSEADRAFLYLSTQVYGERETKSFHYSPAQTMELRRETVSMHNHAIVQPFLSAKLLFKLSEFKPVGFGLDRDGDAASFGLCRADCLCPCFLAVSLLEIAAADRELLSKVA